MLIKNKQIKSKNLMWTLRCPTKYDAIELSKLRIQIDGETENLYREPGEDFITAEKFEKMICEDSIVEKNLFLVAEVEGKIVGFTRCEGNKLTRFRHKIEFGIGIAKKYWGYGIGTILLEHILLWAEENGIKKISLTVVETNLRAIQLYERYGFVKEGLLLQDRIHKDGNYYNTVIMGKLLNK